MSTSGLAGLIGVLNPEVGAMQVAQQHAGSIIFGVLIALGILIIAISFVVMSTTKAPHTKSWVFAGLGIAMALGGGLGVFMAERKHFR